jgi:ankyrin repeat protein
MGGAASAAERAWTCAQQGRAQELRALLAQMSRDASREPRAAAQQALWVAAYNDHADAVRAILESPCGARAVDGENVQQLTALWIACRHGCERAVGALLAGKAGVGGGCGAWFDGTAVAVAAHGGHCDVVRQLVEARADVDAADATGATATHRAAVLGHSRVVSLLLSARASVNQPDVEGRTPVHRAAGQDHPAIVEALARARADVNRRDELFGETPLHRALSLSREGPFGVVAVLAHAKADVNLADWHGRTPLFCAARHGMRGAVEILVRAKADVDRTSPGVETPVRAAAARGHVQVVDLLVRAKARVT